MDISVIINAHREGLLVVPSIKSALAAAAEARKKGYEVEILAILDSPDALTTEIFERFIPQIQVHKIEERDLAHARNYAAVQATGRWMAFLDADDLWSPNWLYATVALADKEYTRREIVWHPEVNLFFGTRPEIMIHVDGDDARFDAFNLAFRNYWTALSFVRTELVRECPYPKRNPAAQVGYEDWSWNMAVMARGAQHKVVPGTGHAIRRKAVSMVVLDSAAGVRPEMTDLFVNMIGA